MELAKCPRCGKLFNRVKLSVCQPCELDEDKEILQVQSYIRDHPGLSLEEVSNDLNIYLDDIERWINERRMTIEVMDSASLKCLFCGVPIVTGRACARCSERLELPAPPAPPSEKKSSPREPHLPSRDRGTGGFGVAQKYRRD